LAQKSTELLLKQINHHHQLFKSTSTVQLLNSNAVHNTILAQEVQRFLSD